MKKICIAVTGLHGAGKTMFISSLAYNLLQGGRMLPNVFDRRPFRAFLTQEKELPAFPLYDYMQALQSRPARWPRPTEDLSALNLLLRFEPRHGISRFMQQLGSKGESLVNRYYSREIRLIDYPGEWLLDIPLAEGKISYEDWCEQCFALAGAMPRLQAASEWLHHIQHHCRPELPANETSIQTAALLYREYLERCRDQYGLSMLQPGHFLQPGSLDKKLLQFCPLPVPDRAKIVRNSMHDVMRQRFQAFCLAIKNKNMSWLRQVDAQIVLLDLPGLLNKGKDAFNDAEHTLRAVINNFYGHSWWPLPRGVRRLVYCASKADCFLEADYLNVKSILHSMLQDSAGKAVRKGIPLSCELVSALRCTTEKAARGCTVMLAPGYKDQNGNPMLWDVGRIAHHYPPQWDNLEYGLPPESIPPPDDNYQQGLLNINIAHIINLLCKDILP